MTPLLKNITHKEKLRLATLNFLYNTEDLANRAKILADEINNLDLDVLCLQEVPFLSYPDSEMLTILEELTDLKVVATHQHKKLPDKDTGIVTLTKLPQAQESTVIPFDTPVGGAQISENAILASLLSPQGRTLNIINAHLAWGGHRENFRLDQAITINKHANNLSKTPNLLATYLAGDLNTTPQTMTSAYLRGEYVPSTEKEGAYWIDSWGHLHPQEPGITSNGHGYWSRSTAISQGIMIPELMPSRRIDYLMAHGWTYGKTGSPIEAGQFVDQPETAISDHKGVWVDIWDPVV